MKPNSEISIFTEKKEFYTPEYKWALELIDQQNAVFWKFDETNIDADYHDLKHNLTPAELHGISEALKLFTTYETRIGNDYWSGVVKKVFKQPEIQMLAITNAYFECLTPDTEVLTSEGWKHIPEVTKELLVAQYDINSGEISFTNPKELVSNFRDEELIEFSGKRISQFVTKNHRMPTIGAQPHNRGIREFILADDMKSNGSYNIPLTGIKTSGISEFTALDKLKIATQADGKVLGMSDERYTGEFSNCQPIKFHFKKDRKKNRMVEILQELQFEYTVSTINGVSDDGYEWFYVKVPMEHDVKSWKTFDWVDLASYSNTWFYAFIQELRHWDGQHNSKSIRYVNTVLSAHEKIQMMATLCGLVATIEHRVDHKRDRQLIYCTHISYKGHTTTRDMPIIKQHYTGNVYCLVVDTGAFVVRRNGKVSITGNCVHARAYNEINKCMGLDTEEFYTSYKHDEVLAERIKFIEDSCIIPKDYNALDVLKSLGTFLFIEGAVLYSSFAFIKHFSSNGKNYLKNMNAAIDYSIRDEGFFHVTSGEYLFKTLKDQADLTADELNELNQHLQMIGRKTYEHEEKIMEKLFSGGKILGITVGQMKTFIKSRINECLHCLENDPIYEKESYNKIGEWFYNNISGMKQTDFFNRKGSSYSRKWKKHKFTW